MLTGRIAGALALVTVTIIAGLAAPGIAQRIVSLGRNIPQPYMADDYLRAIAWSIVFTAVIAFVPLPERDRPFVMALWLVKVALALGPMLFYERFYAELDAFWYFGESARGTFTDWSFKLGEGTENVAIVASAALNVLGRSYHSLKLAFALVGLAAVYLFYRAGVLLSGRHDPRMLLALGCVPTILFWSTIIGKDPLTLFGIALYTWAIVAWQRSGRPIYIAGVAAGFFVATLFRLFIGPILLAPLAWLIVRGEPRWSRRMLYLTAFAGAFLLAVQQFNAYFRLENLQNLLETANSLSRAFAIGGSAQQIGEFTSFGRLFAFAPLGAFTALYRPIPGEVLNPFGLLAGLENAGLLVLTFYALRRSRREHWRDPVVQWAAVFVVVWAFSYGIVSYQNLGAAVRFKLQIMPVLVGLLLHLAFTPASAEQR